MERGHVNSGRAVEEKNWKKGNVFPNDHQGTIGKQKSSGDMLEQLGDIQLCDLQEMQHQPQKKTQKKRKKKNQVLAALQVEQPTQQYTVPVTTAPTSNAELQVDETNVTAEQPGTSSQPKLIEIVDLDLDEILDEYIDHAVDIRSPDNIYAAASSSILEEIKNPGQNPSKKALAIESIEKMLMDFETADTTLDLSLNKNLYKREASRTIPDARTPRRPRKRQYVRPQNPRPIFPKGSDETLVIVTGTETSTYNYFFNNSTDSRVLVQTVNTDRVSAEQPRPTQVFTFDPQLQNLEPPSETESHQASAVPQRRGCEKPKQKHKTAR